MQSNIEDIGAAQVCIMAGIALQLVDTLMPKIFTKLASNSSPGLLHFTVFNIMASWRPQGPQGLA